MRNRIILYPPDETEYIDHGLGVLSDAISCDVTEILNGSFELAMVYPSDTDMFRKIDYRMIIFCKPSPDRNPEPFRIYRIFAPANGRVKVYARHISYDADGIPVSPFSAVDSTSAISQINKNAAVDNPFVLSIDQIQKDIHMPIPQSLRACIFGKENSLLSVYGGEVAFNRNQIRILSERGSDKGYKIRYGVNLIDAQQEKNCENVYTGIYPYFYEETGDVQTLVELPEKIVNVPGSFGYDRILPVDLSSEFDVVPSEDDLRDAAETYISAHNIGIPDVDLSVEFAPLRQFEEYKHISFLESVELGDTVHIFFEKIGVNSSSRVVQTVYDALRDRYKVINIGKTRPTIIDTIDDIVTSVDKSRTLALSNKSNIKAINQGIGSIQTDMDELYLKVDGEFVKIHADLSGVHDIINQAQQDAIIVVGEIKNINDKVVGLTQQVTDNTGAISEITQLAGQVNVVVKNEDGTLSSIINPEEISIKKLDANGNMVSGFYYDTDDGIFKFYGTGEFRSADGKSYVAIDNDEFLLKSRTGTAGSYINIIRMGYTTDGSGVDYPYIFIGNTEGSLTSYSGTAMIKKFKNGLWVGNSAPKSMMGSFSGKEGAVGFFVDTENGVPYAVNGTELTEVYLGDAIAKFA